MLIIYIYWSSWTNVCKAMYILGWCNGWNNFIPLSRNKDLSLNSSPLLFIWQNRITFAPLPLKPRWHPQADKQKPRREGTRARPAALRSQKLPLRAAWSPSPSGRHLEGSPGRCLEYLPTPPASCWLLRIIEAVWPKAGPSWDPRWVKACQPIRVDPLVCQSFSCSCVSTRKLASQDAGWAGSTSDPKPNQQEMLLEFYKATP